MAELEVSNLELGGLAVNDGPVFAPVELKRFSRAEAQGHEGAPCSGLFGLVLRSLPSAGKGCDSAVGAGEAQADQVGVKLHGGAPLFACLAGFALEPG